MTRSKKHTVEFYIEKFSIPVAIILIWRGMWYLFDFIDRDLFGGTHFLTALIGIAIGLLLLYIHDREFRDLEIF